MKNQPSLQDKVALVTGGSRGIGRAITLKLAGLGAYVIVNYVKNLAAAEETLALVRTGGGNGEVLQFDVADTEGTRKVIAEVIARKGKIDILVNNAGTSADGLLVRMKDRDWESVIRTNLTGTYNCCRAVAYAMMKRRWGRIINITSVVAASGNAGQVNYSASKAGIIGLTKSLARELGPRNICVNAVAPGFILTDMTESLPAEVRGQIREQIPLSKPGTPEDVGALVAFLATEEAAYITGQVIHVNGGLYM
ncbi:MAG TPA: 3-oxoacyl-[acyl-carrier-protein] reductase [Syntrophales bacterium]|nr:3-oxoacyl-[acyl-carrier-protein] reductase [Syntrophales bacterium]HOX94604.1 3-oxoacyl-[acyl-carrier-protein] reductase [Syntrophales bacterium]HPI58031.1 3-oxoacyl-[acyl-carrier-protein] reductase [Syntrophales bacterium]HPN25247.1 3-oxoacyl-[acyl-carrier-protein] reductase [Syntrophales bacterium]HQM29334.1 3-oxoacyl-[acyl-carrier-protein] reductase [Syntrophales bacterium]